MPFQTVDWIDGRIRSLISHLQPMQIHGAFPLFAELSALSEVRLNLLSAPQPRVGPDLTGVQSPSTAALLILHHAGEPLKRREIVRRAVIGGWMPEGGSPRRINQAITSFMEGVSHPGTEWTPLFYMEQDGFHGKDVNENRIGLIEWRKADAGEVVQRYRESHPG